MAKIKAFSELSNIFVNYFNKSENLKLFMKKVLGLGNALVDVMTPLKDDSIIEQLGFARGSMNLVDKEKSREIKERTAEFVTSMASGGSAANTIHGLSKLGVFSGFIGAIGDDPTGRIFEKNMQSAGVKTHLCFKDTDTGTAVAMISPDSERTFATHLGAAEMIRADDLDRNVFREYDLLYLEGYLISNLELVERACSYAKEEGLKIAIDLSSFNVVEIFMDDFTNIIDKYVDIIFANELEAKAFTGKEAEEALKMLAAKSEIAVVKTGEKGSLIQGSLIYAAEGMSKVDALDVESIDSTGAGDLYASGFIYGLVNNASLEKCGAYGTKLAAEVIQVIGPKIDKYAWPEIKKTFVESTDR